MIKIKIVDNLKDEIGKDAKDLKNLSKGEAKLENKHVITLTPEGFHSLFSPERIRLLKALKENNFGSIYNLAKKLNRRYEAIYRDIKYLEGFGLIEIKSENRNKVPVLSGNIQIPALV